MNKKDFLPPGLENANYRPEIDGLRCIAVCTVIFYHFGISLFPGGFIGVDIFFVISGFLITRIIHDAILAGKFSFIGFYERRARRILPAIFVVLLTSSITAWFLLTPKQLKDFAQSLIGVVGFFSNHYFLKKTGYFSPNAEEIPLLHTWTLSVEEQFYVVLPIILIVLWRFRRDWINKTLVALFAVSLSLCLFWEARQNTEVNFFMAASRAWEFLIGALLATKIEKSWPREQIKTSTANILSAVGVFMILFAATCFTAQTSFPGVYALFPVLGSALVIRYATEKTLVGRALASPPFVGIGLISYSAYLWHQPLLAFSRLAIGDHPDSTMIVLLLLATGILAYLSWRFVERPFRNPHKVSRKTIAVLSIGGTFLFATLGVIGHVKKGFPERFSTSQNSLAETATPSPFREKCHTDGVLYLKPANACRYFSQEASWAVFGDSHAVEISYALAEYLRDRRAGGVLHLSNSGCQPALLFQSDVPGCSAWTKEALHYLENEKNIRHVVIVYRHSFYLSGPPSKTYPAIPDEHPNFLEALSAGEARETYWKSLMEIITRLKDAGKIVHLVEPVPELGRPVEWNIFSHNMSAAGAGRKRGTDYDYYRKRNAFILSKMQSLKNDSRFFVVPTSKVFCDGKECAVLTENASLYFDDNHLSLTGARKLAQFILAGHTLN